MVQNNNENTVILHQGRFGLSLLNGMIGSYLEKEKNPLAVKMGFYNKSHKLSFDEPLQPQVDFPLSNRVVIFVHGLVNLENAWDYPPDDGKTASILSHYIDVCFDASPPPTEQSYGSKLQQEFGYSPFYLRYNTGLLPDKNGRNLSHLIERLFKTYPVKIDELVLVGSGMGGSLLSHAQYAAQQHDSGWLAALAKCIYLGNLNEGSLWALMLQLSSNLLRHLPIHYGQTLADWLELRNARIHKARVFQGKAPMSFHEKSQHFFIRGGLRTHTSTDDGSDRRTSAGKEYRDGVNAPAHSQDTYLEGITTLRLTHSDRVYALIAQWLQLSPRDVASVPAKTLVTTPEQTTQTPCQTDHLHEDVWRRAMLAGSLDLVASAYDRAIIFAEEMHHSIAEKPFYVLEKLPVLSYLADPVEGAQRDMLNTLYKSLRYQGRLMHQYATQIIQDEGSRDEKATRTLTAEVG